MNFSFGLMSSSLKIILIVVSSVIILVAGYFAYQYYQEYNQPHAKAISAVSPTSAVFAEIHDPQSWLSGLVHEKEWWQALAQIPAVESLDKLALSLNTAFSANSWISEVLESQKAFVSVEKVSGLNFGLVFLVELPNGHGESGIRNFIHNHFDGDVLSNEMQYQDALILGLVLQAPHEEFFYSVYKGLFIGSFEASLVEESIDQLNSDVSVNFDKNFQRIEATAGKNVDANIYINHSSFSQWVSSMAIDKKSNFALSLANLGFWTETDLVIKSDELLFNGYTITSDSLNQLENYKTSPHIVTAPEVLPVNIAWMLDLGIGDLKEFINGRKEMFGADSASYDQFLADFKMTYKIDLLQEIYPWAGHEIAIAEISNENKTKNKQVAVFRAKDILKAAISLENLSRKINKVKAKKLFSLNHGEYTIKKLNHPQLLSFLFGPIFSSIKENYYIAIRDYIVFANSPDVLKYLIDEFYNRKTLSGDANYITFSNNISDNSNIYFYVNFRKATNIVNSYLNEKTAQAILNHRNTLEQFEGMAIQFSYIHQMFYTNIYLKFNPDYQEVNSLSWEHELDNALLNNISLVKNHRNDKLNVVAFDESNNMYLLDHLGREKWKLPLIENPESEVFLVDYFKNGKFQYLFNTENYLYLVDLNGNHVADFPSKFVAGASGPMNVFDYNNDKDYRILVPLNDNRIYNFNINGQPIDGWKKIQSKATVKVPVQHLVVKNKDYLFTTDENGNVVITNRRGEFRVKMKKSFSKSENANFYQNETNNKGLFITTDNKGNLVYVSEKGKIQSTEFGGFSSEHFFLYEDFDQNGSLDFIFLDGNKLIIFDRFKKVLFTHEFSEVILQKPVFYKHMGKNYLGVILTAANEIQLFNMKGRIFSDQTFSGNRVFVTGSLNNDHKLNIISGFEKKVVSYLIEQN